LLSVIIVNCYFAYKSSAFWPTTAHIAPFLSIIPHLDAAQPQNGHAKCHTKAALACAVKQSEGQKCIAHFHPLDINMEIKNSGSTVISVS